LHQIDHTPSHHAVDGRYRAALDRSGQGGAGARRSGSASDRALCSRPAPRGRPRSA
jgi:hypothetical protein